MFEQASGKGGKDQVEPLNIQLPEKKYFRIGEVANLLMVKPYVLRYWETEFNQLRPQKSRTGQRLYRRKDVESLITIRDLLYVKKYTIAGARQALKTGVSLLDGMPEATSAQDSFVGPADTSAEVAVDAKEMPKQKGAMAQDKNDQSAFGFGNTLFKDLAEIESDLKNVISILDKADVAAQSRMKAWKYAS